MAARGIGHRFFVAVYVERMRTPGSGNTYLRMRILPKKTYSQTDPGIVVGDDSTPDSGMSVMRLLG